MVLRGLAVVVLAASTFLGAGGEARAKESPIAIGEVAPPPRGAGIDVAGLRAAARSELARLEPIRLPAKRRVVVSFALTRAALAGPVACTVNATLRDARTGAMIAVIEAGAQADGPQSAEARKQVARAAVKSAVRGIPRALGAR